MWPLVLSELWAPKGKIFHEVHWWFLGDLVGSFPGLMTTVMYSLLPPFFHERHGLWETLLLGSSHSSCAWKVEISPNDLTWLSFDHVTCMTPWVLISGNTSYFQITCLSVHSLSFDHYSVKWSTFATGHFQTEGRAKSPVWGLMHGHHCGRNKLNVLPLPTSACRRKGKK